MAYEYVRKAYGVPAIIGHRVEWDARTGTIVKPASGEDARLHVRFDGETRARRLHPTDDTLKYLGVEPIVTELRRLIVVVDEKVVSVGAAPSFDPYDRAVHEAYWKRLRQLISDLQHEEKARYRVGVSGPDALSLGGVTTSCTGGIAGLLRNWRMAAARRIDQLEAEV